MVSDLEQRLRILLEEFVDGVQPSVTRLSMILNVPEEKVQEALSVLEAKISAPIEQTIHGTANTQVGNYNAQVYVHGPLVTMPASGEEIPNADDLRALMSQPDELHDTLERYLVRQRSKRLLTRVLAISTEQPEWERLFQEWVKDTPALHGQPWFVKTAVAHFSDELSNEAASRRYEFFQLLFSGLLDVYQEKAALELFKSFLKQLEAVIHWDNSHWNVLYAVIKTFWCQSDLGETRLYASQERREETQHWVYIYLRHMSDHFRHAENANNTNELLTALAYLLQSIDSDAIISLIDHCTEDKWLAEVLDMQTARELLNALDQARRPSKWWEETEMPEARLHRHSYADLVAKQILKHVEHQIGHNKYFYELVNRAGMVETEDGELISTYTLGVGKRGR